MNTLQVATIKAATIGTPTGRGGGAKAPSPADCMKDCIAWYSPKRQGITNEYLQDHYLDDDAVLQDLSGNGNDIALHNMEGEEGGGYVNDDGDLVFDGSDDYGECVKQIASADLLNGAFATVVDTSYHDGYKHVYFCCFEGDNPTSSNHIFSLYKDGSGEGRYYMGYNKQLNRIYWLKDSTIEENMLSLIVNTLVGCQPDASFNTTIAFFPGVTSGKNAIIQTPEEVDAMWVGRNQNGYFPLFFRELLFFKRNLTHKEAEWVYDNILTTDTNNQNS